MKAIQKTLLPAVQVLVMLLFCLAGSVPVGAEQPHTGSRVTCADFNGKRAGIITGSIHDDIIRKNLPDCEISSYNNYTDLSAALLSGRIDFFLASQPSALALMAERDEFSYIEEPLDYLHAGAMFRKTERGDHLREQMDAFLTKIREDGTLAELSERWENGVLDETAVDPDSLTGENGTIVFATAPSQPPVAYVSNGEITGRDVDIAVRFCREYGYAMEIRSADVAGILSGVVTGMYDLGMADIVITEERKESVNFSVPYNSGEILIVARKSDLISQDAAIIEALNDEGRTVGAATGASGMFAVEQNLPKAKMLLYDDLVTAAEAVRLGRIDAFVYERRSLEIAVANGMEDVRLLDEPLGESIPVAIGISRVSKVSGLQEEFNAFLAEMKENGTIDEMERRWVFDSDYTMPDIPEPASPDRTVVIGTSGLSEPFSFYIGDQVTGFDMELARRFALWANVRTEIAVNSYSGLIAAAESGTIDCIIANLNVTEERAQVIDFTDPIYHFENGVLVRDTEDGGLQSGGSFLHSIAGSFEKNILRENRWKLIVQGIGMTCLITALSAIFGSILAFLICLFRRTESRLANAIADIYVKLLQGTPIVVLLMILYYVVFGRSGVDSAAVAVIGFSLNFGAYVSEIMRSGIESIDCGQREAALALGFNEHQAFFRFIFPQAAMRFLPVYRGEVISLLKNTSVVGYIAIQDLTKMSDIIRSRTYEAFFPLIVTAIIYFLIAWVLSLLLKGILHRIDPKRRKRKAGAV